MHSVRRLLAFLAIVATLAMLSATAVSAKDHTATVNGSSSGTTKNTNGCDPAAPHPTLLLCTFNVHGTYHATGIGSGSYSGKTQVDYAQYGKAGHDPNGGGNCTAVTGKITFKQSEDNTLKTTLAPGSKVCETSTPGVHHTYLVLTITGGTGRFEGATGAINSNGTSTDDAKTAGLHHDTALLGGNITLHHDGGDSGDNGNHGDGGDNND